MWRALHPRGRATAEMDEWHVANAWWALATLQVAIPAEVKHTLQAALDQAAPAMPPISGLHHACGRQSCLTPGAPWQR